MQVLLIGELVAKTRLSESTIYERIKNRARENPPFPAPIPLGARRRGWIEREVDQYLEACALLRDQLPKAENAGREKFWADVREGKRLHPRTVGRLKRERAQGCTSQWVVVVNGRGGENREQFAADRADAQRLLERLRKENPTAAAWMCERVTRHQVLAQESDDAGAS